jgi:hypothetical protein
MPSPKLSDQERKFPPALSGAYVSQREGWKEIEVDSDVGSWRDGQEWGFPATLRGGHWDTVTIPNRGDRHGEFPRTLSSSHRRSYRPHSMDIDDFGPIPRSQTLVEDVQPSVARGAEQRRWRYPNQIIGQGMSETL